MSLKNVLKYTFLSIGKGFLCSLFLIIGMVIGGIFSAIFGLKQPTMPESINTTLTILLMIPAGILIAITLGELFKKLNQSFFERLFCLFLFNYIIYYFLQVLEQIIFTTMMNFEYGIISGIFPSFFLSLAVSRLWKPKKGDKKITIEIRRFFARRKTLDWTWRLTVAWIAYVPLYYIVGMVISPWVLPYYTNQNVELGLVLPDMNIMIGMQFIRGAFYLLSALFIIILWKHSKRSLELWLGFAFFIQIAAIPLIVGYWLPIGLRIPHAIELCIDSFVQAFIYGEILFK